MINCFAITGEDNFVALATYLEQYPLARLMGSYHGGSLNYSDVMELGVHLVFVDYVLVSEFRPMLEKLSQHMSVVYLSDHSASAYQAFEDGVLDFITYPFDFERLKKCIHKLMRFSMLMPVAQPKQKQPAGMDSFFVKPDKGRRELLLNCNDVLFIEAFQNDVAIQMTDGRRFVCCHTMKEMEESLSSCFMRVHKSFIINYKKMSAFDGSHIILATGTEFRIPLGGVYKKAFLDRRSTMIIGKSSRAKEAQYD